MHKAVVSFFVFFFISLQSFAQPQRKVATYLMAQYNKTIYDYTTGNNPWGAGLGLQAFYHNNTKFKPTIEITADIYLEDDKLLRLDPDGNFPGDDNSLDGMINVFGGATYQLNESSYVSLVAGPAFISGKTLAGIKPSLGFYLSSSQKWTGKLSYINIFNRVKPGHDFGTISLSIGLKLY